MEDSLICTPPPTPQDFLFQGVFDDPPFPQEFPEFLNRFSLTILWKFRVVLVLKNNESEYQLSYENTVEFYYNSVV